MPKRSRSRSSASKAPEFCSTRPALASTAQQTPSNIVGAAPLHMGSPTLPAHSSVAAQHVSNVTPPVLVFVTAAPSTQSVVGPQHTVTGFSPPVALSTQSVVGPQHTVTGFSPQVATSTQSVQSVSSVSATATPPLSVSQPNTNPFYVKFIKGNIRMCQGCRQPLRSMNGSIPSPPFDLAIARSERTSFCDKFGTLVTPLQEQTCHYHLSLQCVKAVEPHFVPFSLKVPLDVVPGLTAVHKEYLGLVFGITFL